jgi:hypothetical protein
MALRYFVNGGLNNNWTQTGAQSNWSTAPGGAGGASVPTSADDVIFDASSPNCNLNGNGTCLSFDANTYGAKTWSLNSNSINVGTGIFRLGAGMTVTGNGTFIRNTNVAGTMTMTSNGVVWPGNVTFAINAAGMAWADNWTILGNFSFGAFASVTGTATITIGGSLTNAGGVSAGPSSTATYVLNGTGTLDGNFGMLIIINTSGVITLTTSLRPGTLNYITGSVIVNPGHTYIITTGSSHLTDRTSTGGSKINFFNLTGSQSGTVTLLSNLTVTNNYTNNINVIFAGGFTIFIAGNLSSSGYIYNPSLTKTTLELNGPTSSTVQSTTSPPIIGTNLIINKSASATVTFLSNLFFGDSTNSILELTAGIVNPGAFTVTTNTSCIINNMTLNNLTVSAGHTVTQNVLNTINNNLTLNGSATFAGTAGWVCANLVSTAAGTFTVTLQQAVTYRTRLQAFITGGVSGAARTTIISSGASTRAIWTLDQGASQSLIYVNGTRIDSSQGQTVWTFGGLISTTPVGAETLNWNIGSPPGTFAYTFLT